MSLFKRKESKAVVAVNPVKHEVLHGFMHKIKEAAKGVVRTGWGDSTNRLPHPSNMERYAELCRDPTVSVAIDIKRDMVVPDFYYEMPEEETKEKPKQTVGLNPDEEPDGAPKSFGKPKVEAVPVDAEPKAKPKITAKPITDDAPVEPEHPNKKKLEEWKKNTKAIKKLKQIVSTMISKGFCPVEITDDYNLKVLPPESFFIYRDKTGEVLKYTQEDSMKVLNTWQGKTMDDIILFINDEDTDHPYGEADVESLAVLLDTRKELNEDMGRIIKRFSAPLIGIRSDGSALAIQKNMVEKEIDEALFLGNTPKDQVEFMVIEPDPQCKFLPYIDSVDFQIGQKLNAPLILLLKNATEASATKMLDAIDRWVQSTQNELAEILEERIYKKICGSGPIPIHKWGAPKEVLDEITLSDISQLTDKTISKRQAQDLIRQKGIELLEDEEFVNKQPEPPAFGNPFGAAQDKAPFGAKPEPKGIPIPVEKLNDLNLALELIEANLKMNRRQPNIIPETCKRAEEAIRVYMQRVYPDEWQPRYEAMFQQFIHERLGGSAKKQTYTVNVG